MTQPRDEFERRAEASEQAQDEGRSLVRSPALTVRRVLLAVVPLLLGVLVAQVVEAQAGPTWAATVASTSGIAAAIVVITGGSLRR